MEIFLKGVFREITTPSLSHSSLGCPDSQQAQAAITRLKSADYPVGAAFRCDSPAETITALVELKSKMRGGYNAAVSPSESPKGNPSKFLLLTARTPDIFNQAQQILNGLNVFQIREGNNSAAQFGPDIPSKIFPGPSQSVPAGAC